MAKKEYTTVEAAGHEIRISSPSKVYFPKPKHTKLDLVEYYLAVEEAAVNQLRERPGTMKRFVDGVGGEFFFQKRVPKGAPDWLQTATFTFPTGVITAAVPQAKTSLKRPLSRPRCQSSTLNSRSSTL